jgi:hypothetical protein
MRPPTALLACFACLLARPGVSWAGDVVDITYAGGLLTVRCAAVPLAEVLKQVGSATGMELVLDNSVKKTLLTAEVEAQPESLALERLLEGSGVTYAMSLAPDGKHVARMYVGSEAGGKNAAGPSPARGASTPAPAGDRVPRGLPLPPRPTPAWAGPVAATDEEDDDIDVELDGEPSPFAGLGPEDLPGIPSSALPPGGPALDSFGRPIPGPRVSPPAPTTESKPASSVNQ